MSADAHAALIRGLYEIGAIRFGQFTLKSGIVSPFYIDLRVVISFPEVLEQIGVLMAAEVRRCGGERVGGIPYAGLPLAVATSLSSTLIVVKLLSDKFELSTFGGRVTLGILIFQDRHAIAFMPCPAAQPGSLQALVRRAARCRAPGRRTLPS